MNPDQELARNRAYQRILAELSPDERLRLLGADFDLRCQLDKKREYRRTISALSPEKKLALLEELRNRDQLLQGRRRSPPLNPQAAEDASGAGQQLQGDQRNRRLPRSRCSNAQSHRFGGRATVGGVNFEVRIAAFIAVKMLAGSRCSLWTGISGADVASITMQAAEPVDDIVVNLRGVPEASVFISAKARSGTIPLTPKSPAFADTVDSFVRQFLKLTSVARGKSRLLWAIPSSAGPAATRELAEALDTLRMEENSRSLSEFLQGRQLKQAKALQALQSAAQTSWKRHSGELATDEEMASFLRQVYVEIYEFECGQRCERQAQTDIRSQIVEDSERAEQVWQKLEHFFARVDQRGVRVTPDSLRRALVGGGITLKSRPDYAEDIARLQELTTRNLERLREHTTLPFGARSIDFVHIQRAEELSSLLDAAKRGNLLLTGEPGSGKSGLIHPLVEALQRENCPVVLLLADEVFDLMGTGSTNPAGLRHPLADVLGNWPTTARGFLVTDALDAVRDPDTQKRLRRLLRDVRDRQPHWKLVASVREFDLKFGRELREAFPGTGVAGYSSNEFAGVAHFHLSRLSEPQLDELAVKRPEISPFIQKARGNAKSGGIHRSPFYLRLAAELLHAGVTPARLGDWHSPALLLRKFWQTRINEGAGASARGDVLRAVCRRMVDTRRMAVSLKQFTLSASERNQVDELRSRGILQTPTLRHGTQVGGDDMRFTHHLLHDYAVAISVIPGTPACFCDFAVDEPLLPIFYRQSFMFALEELWDSADGRLGFWESTLKLESSPQLHNITRILAPILAARRVESLGDLQPLLTAVASTTDANSPVHLALRHLASGIQDADENSLRAGVSGWCPFAAELAGLLQTNASVEGPLVQILARLTTVSSASDIGARLALNRAARGLIAHHVSKTVAKGWRFAALVAIEALSKTFATAPIESERALLSLLTRERLVQFPHDDLHYLADNLKHIGGMGEIVVLRLFEAAFSTEPTPGEWEQRGSAIMGMQFQTCDQWNSIHYALAGYYEARKDGDPGLMTELACIAWNAVVRRRSARRTRQDEALATIQLRGVPCQLIEDYSHIWGREFEHEENRILSHFEGLLLGWAAAGDRVLLDSVLHHFALRNRTSLMWTVFLEAAARHPSTLGVLLEGVLDDSLFLTHPDYSYAGTGLLGALHRAGDAPQQERLEMLILNLPKNARLHKGEPRDPTPPWLEHCQNRLLGVLQEGNIVVGAVLDLWKRRREAQALTANPRPSAPRVISRTFSDKEAAARNGIDFNDPANPGMFRMREALKQLLGRDKAVIDPNELDPHWPVIQQCERMLRRHGTSHPKMSEDLWGHLVGACETIARHAVWPRTNQRWKTVRRILLKASHHAVPRAGDDEDAREDRWPSWSWPSPRLDAARGLPLLAYRLGQTDKDVGAALRRLCRDQSIPLRFNLALEVAALEKASPALMWELIDTFIENEKSLSVLDALLVSVDRLWSAAAEKVKPRVRRIAERVMNSPAAGNRIHETLAHTHLFHFLRTGDKESEVFMGSLIAECDSPRASQALAAMLHAIRVGGWLTVDNDSPLGACAEGVRARTWTFVSNLLATAQRKLGEHREACGQIQEQGHGGMEGLQALQGKLDRATRLVDAVAMQLYFASGAFGEGNDKGRVRLTPAQSRGFWEEAASIFAALAAEPHPHTAHQVVQALHHLLPWAPREIFLLATKCIRTSATAGFQHESLAVDDVVRFIQRVLSDHREIFQDPVGQQSECLEALLQVLDLFVEAGWAEARQLTHRLEEIYR